MSAENISATWIEIAVPLARAVNAPMPIDAPRPATATSRLGKAVTSPRTPQAVSPIAAPRHFTIVTRMSHTVPPVLVSLAPVTRPPIIASRTSAVAQTSKSAVAQTSKSAVSQVSKPAGCGLRAGGRALELRPAADLETGATTVNAPHS